MKSIKTKCSAWLGGIGALCFLCCSFPVLGLMGLGSIEAIFCENQYLKWIGIFFMGIATVLFLSKLSKEGYKVKACSLDCGCKDNF
jgi:hypothetical protein